MIKKIPLFVKRNCWRPTFWGWLFIFVVIGLLFRVWMGTVCEYLTVNKPVPAKIMVIEGWVEDYALKEAMEYYKRNNYKHLIITGLPLKHWEDFVIFPNTARAAAAVLKTYGFKDSIYEAVIPPSVYIDRTYNTAVATRMLLSKHSDWGKSFNIFSVGVHSRRTLLMFKRAFGDTYKIGIIAATDRTFNPKRWWTTSKGFRNVSNEFVAYLFVWAFFHPDYVTYEKKLEEGYQLEKLKNN